LTPRPWRSGTAKSATRYFGLLCAFFAPRLTLCLNRPIQRIDPRGNSQYTYIDETSRYANLLIDPYVKPSDRKAVQESMDVLVLGGGFSG
jgi:hypothetical protein